MVRTDDQDLASFNARYMPETTKLFRRRGTIFSNAIVSTPQCCPSRAAVLTGQYAHNNGVTRNFPGYNLLRDSDNVLPVWLQRAGYTTIHIGKYLNGYGETHGLEPAPGWDRWRHLGATLYLTPSFSIDGTRHRYDEYLGKVTARMSKHLIERYAPRKRPFYLELDEFAPHVSPGEGRGQRCHAATIPDPDDGLLFADEQAPRDRAYNEHDVSDKPEYIQRLPRFEAGMKRDIDRRYGCAVASLRSVDRNFKRLVDQLRRIGELDKTLILFTSDNGYTFGGHRFPYGKGLPYDEHLRVPLAVMPPKSLPRESHRGRTVPAAVSNVDLAPTFLDLAGARPCIGHHQCRRMDGRSLLPLLLGKRPRWSKGRAIRTNFDIGTPAYKLSCAWQGYWRPREDVILHTSLPVGPDYECTPARDWEVYDTRRDPHQLRATGPSRRQIRRLDRLRTCSGIKGRDRPLKRRRFCE